MQESFWWRQCSDRYTISLFPHLHTPFPPSLISLMVSVDVKHHVYLLTIIIIIIENVFSNCTLSIDGILVLSSFFSLSPFLSIIRLSVPWIGVYPEHVAHVLYCLLKIDGTSFDLSTFSCVLIIFWTWL